jgi:site-specific recombinase XerC
MKVPAPRTQKQLPLAISKEQMQTLLNDCHCESDKSLISLLWHSGMRISEAMNVETNDFNLSEGTVIVLGKGNRYRKCLAGNGLVHEWFARHETFEISKSGA